MTRKQQKTYNAENYPASVLTWLNEATDRAFDEFENRTCENCINKPLPNENYLEVCGTCSRWYSDNYEERNDD